MKYDKKSIRDMPCKNCGECWGSHSGNSCSTKRGYNGLFTPVPLNTICVNCGKPLSQHRSHLYCMATSVPTSSTFHYADGPMFDLDEELFEL